jgi:protein TonB
MSGSIKRINDFADIVFEKRNKEYGAFVLRKKYSRNVIISLLIGTAIMITVIIIPYLNVKAQGTRQNRSERKVEIKMENLDQTDKIILPPPPPTPPVNVIQQVKYVPPVVVDSVNLVDTIHLMTADEAQANVKNDDPIEIVKEVKEEVQEDKPVHEPFLTVQEMPVPKGGLDALYKYISRMTQYPLLAKENNIEGKVYVRFCVTAEGAVDQVSILKSVDPELDAEALRVVKTFPSFTPGKQDGRPVPVWFVVFINFQLQ